MYIFKCSNRVLLCCVSIIYTFKHVFFVSLRCNVLHLLIHHHILVYFRTLQLWVSWKKRLCLWWVDRWYFVKLSTVFSLPRSQYTLSCFFVNSISYPIQFYIHYFYSFAFIVFVMTPRAIILSVLVGIGGYAWPTSMSVFQWRVYWYS